MAEKNTGERKWLLKSLIMLAATLAQTDQGLAARHFVKSHPPLGC
jgi:hypothetical protein